MGIIDYVMGGILGLCMLALVGLLGFLGYEALDDIGAKTGTTTGQIIDVSFRAEHTEIQDVMIGKTLMPMSVPVPDKWYLEIATPDGGGWMAIENAPFIWEQKGSKVVVKYKTGLFSKAFYITEIDAITNN